jgi:hypothetical protein
MVCSELGASRSGGLRAWIITLRTSAGRGSVILFRVDVAVDHMVDAHRRAVGAGRHAELTFSIPVTRTGPTRSCAGCSTSAVVDFEVIIV